MRSREIIRQGITTDSVHSIFYENVLIIHQPGINSLLSNKVRGIMGSISIGKLMYFVGNVVSDA